MKELTAFEVQRLENIKKNQELLKSLGIGEPDAKIGSPPPTPPPRQPRKKKVVQPRDSSTPDPILPTRKSSRSIPNKSSTSYLEIGQDGLPLNHHEKSSKRPLKKLSNKFIRDVDREVQPRSLPSRRSGRNSSKGDGQDGDGNGTKASARGGGGGGGLYRDWDTEDEDEEVQYDENGYKVLTTPESKPGSKKRKSNPNQSESPSSLQKIRRLGASSSSSSPTSSSSSGTDDTSVALDGEDWVTSRAAPLPQRESLPLGSGKGALLFEKGYGQFRPNLTPEEMLRGGMQGGTAFRSHHSSVLNRVLSPQQDMSKFPTSWFEGLVGGPNDNPDPTSEDQDEEEEDPNNRLTRETYDAKLNRFGVKAGQTLRDWEEAGWINEVDPRGWWQWYFEFYKGRRSRDDERQISRWLKACGPAGRFKRALVQEIHRTDKEWNDESVKPVVRQTLWHWGYELNKPDWEAYLP